MDAERQRIINETARILSEINQQFIDVRYWNTVTRTRLYPSEPPIDPDPTGELAFWKRNFEALLKSEAERGNFPCPTLEVWSDGMPEL